VLRASMLRLGALRRDRAAWWHGCAAFNGSRF
jgi:hypothetical protein